MELTPWTRKEKISHVFKQPVKISVYFNGIIVNGVGRKPKADKLNPFKNFFPSQGSSGQHSTREAVDAPNVIFSVTVHLSVRNNSFF